MSTFVMSDKYPEFVDALKSLGHNIISTDKINVFHTAEQKHADMQILTINNDIFILKECKTLHKKIKSGNLIKTSTNIKKLYPDNILLNFLYLNNCLYGKIKCVDNSLREYCIKNNINFINVKQGYCRCSTLVVNEKAIITSDKNIAETMKNNGVEVLLINAGSIVLDGFNYGFIGGAGGALDDKTIIFFGNIYSHPNYKSIEEFCYNHNKNIRVLCKQMPLTDIGGIVRLNNT